ncbi:hypothetical protein SEA_ZUKO_28 [Streptomyces phage Zuko]|uniref:Uncharacterized protein n=1 Tax=Streptomyces phage Zuko TaxID=2601695 RepID=A0A5J6D7P7_9CAUD|nr:hypothetical protein PP630_gp028 [Streptomyces phage Zuko]QEQ93606.1 hypothetical protein SEA_ZUKO_28 [Streptomyces phage Zuko]
MKRAEYEARAVEFRARLEEISKLPDPKPWPEHDEWLSVPGISTCTTPPDKCSVSNRPFPVLLHENGDGVFRGVCGVCGAAITPVPIFDDDEEG